MKRSWLIAPAGHAAPLLDPALAAQILFLQRDRKWSARRVHFQLTTEGHQEYLRAMGRWLHRVGISWLRDLTLAGGGLRQSAGKIPARSPGHMVPWDVKKIGRVH